MKDGKNYLRERAREGLAEGFRWDGEFEETSSKGAVRIYLDKPNWDRFQAVWLDESNRGGGTFKEALAEVDLPVLTFRECELASYYEYQGISYELAGHFKEWPEYKAISRFYRGRKAKRSGAPYMNHIHEGLGVLYHIDASEDAKKAYCLHPIVQMDKDLKNNKVFLDQLDSKTLALAMEYRNIANSYLSDRKVEGLDDIALSPLKEVNDMLIADKVQNYKDFVKYHKGTHPRSDQLEEYFQNWFERLGVDYSSFSYFLDPFK